jgi:hypothetical protein
MGPSTKLFPANSDLAIKDAALPWQNLSANISTVATPLDRKSFFERRILPSAGITSSTVAMIGTDGEVLSIDKKNSASFYSNTGFRGLSPIAGLNDLVSPPTVVGANVETNLADFNTRNAAVLMAQIETDRIPCPRLCGASFSPGVGGMAG